MGGEVSPSSITGLQGLFLATCDSIRWWGSSSPSLVKIKIWEKSPVCSNLVSIYVWKSLFEVMKRGEQIRFLFINNSEALARLYLWLLLLQALTFPRKQKHDFVSINIQYFWNVIFTFVLWRKKKAEAGVRPAAEKGAKRNLIWGEWVGDQRLVGEDLGPAVWEQSPLLRWGHGQRRGQNCP